MNNHSMPQITTTRVSILPILVSCLALMCGCSSTEDTRAFIPEEQNHETQGLKVVKQESTLSPSVKDHDSLRAPSISKEEFKKRPISSTWHYVGSASVVSIALNYLPDKCVADKGFRVAKKDYIASFSRTTDFSPFAGIAPIPPRPETEQSGEERVVEIFDPGTQNGFRRAMYGPEEHLHRADRSEEHKWSGCQGESLLAIYRGVDNLTEYEEIKTKANQLRNDFANQFTSNEEVKVLRSNWNNCLSKAGVITGDTFHQVTVKEFDGDFNQANRVDSDCRKSTNLDDRLNELAEAIEQRVASAHVEDLNRMNEITRISIVESYKLLGWK